MFIPMMSSLADLEKDGWQVTTKRRSCYLEITYSKKRSRESKRKKFAVLIPYSFTDEEKELFGKIFNYMLMKIIEQNFPTEFDIDLNEMPPDWFSDVGDAVKACRKFCDMLMGIAIGGTIPMEVGGEVAWDGSFRVFTGVSIDLKKKIFHMETADVMSCRRWVPYYLNTVLALAYQTVDMVVETVEKRETEQVCASKGR